MAHADLSRRILDRNANIAVIGCGYVGLPLAVAFGEAGFPVVAIDVDPERVEQLQRGETYLLDVPSQALLDLLQAGRLAATVDYDRLSEADVIFVAVPTPYDRAKQPDLRYVMAAGEQIATRLRHGQLVILESTTYPGTTDEVLRPILERSGLRAGEDFYLAFSPERIDPGNKRFRIQNTSKVVGGVDPLSADLAVCALQQVITEGEVQVVSSTRAAEMTKLLENTFRAVNIALVNELAMLCDRMGIDIWEVIEAAATKPYGYMPFYPGPGVGGHCIPVDPYYLAYKAREYDFHSKFIELAAETNLAMPFFTVGRIRRLLNRANRPMHGARVFAVGASFKRDIDDARNSPAVRVMEILKSEGADVEYHDPYVAEIRLASSLHRSSGDGVCLQSVPLDPDRLAGADCVAILVAHRAIDYDLVLRHARLVFDAVNATRGRTGGALVEFL